MNDRELLELAAKAAGIELDVRSEEEFCTRTKDDVHWNPLTDDGDALRLAVKLKLKIGPDFQVSFDCVMAYTDPHDSSATVMVAERSGNDPYAATRRAIVRAAAEIGKGMK